MNLVTRADLIIKYVASICMALLLLLVATSVEAQQGASLGQGYEFSGTGQPSQVFSDQFSSTCSSGSANPYAGMNPLMCKGV
jgi:hypothetical protein